MTEEKVQKDKERSTNINKTHKT